VVLAITENSDRRPGTQTSETTVWLIEKQAPNITGAHGSIPG